MKEYIALLEDLIRCRPVSSNIPAVNNATMRMRDFLSAHGLYCTLEEALRAEYDCRAWYLSKRSYKVLHYSISLLLESYLKVLESRYR